MRPIVVTVGPLASAVANNIALSQTPSAGPLTLNGSLVVAGVAILDVARRIRFTFAADETGHTILLTGTNWSGSTISETITGTTAGTVDSVLSYKTVTSAVISANATGAMTVGTNTVADSPWVRLDNWSDGNVSAQFNVSGTVNFDVQGSMDDPNSATNPVTPANMTWINSPDLNLVGQTANAQANFALFTPLWMRVRLNSGTGTVTSTISQSSVVGY